MTETKKGAFTVRVTSGDGSVKTLHSLYDPEAEATSIVDAFSFDGRGLLVVLGLGLGYHVRELARRFPGTEIVVVEARPEIYELAERYVMTADLIGRVSFLVGLSAGDAIMEITRRQVKQGVVPVTVFPLSSAVSAFPDYYGPLLSSLRNTERVKLWDRLRYPKFREDVRTVALIDFGYFLTREIECAFGQLGHQVVRVPVNKGDSGEVIVSSLIEAVLECKPDFILTVNHLGLDEDGILTSFLESIEMPLASWYVDSPNLIVKTFRGNVSPYVAIFLWDRSYSEGMRNMGFESVTYLPLATDPAVFRPAAAGTELGPYRCDVGFVGNSMVVPMREKLSRVPERLHTLVEDLSLFLSSNRVSFDSALTTVDEDVRRILGSLPAKEAVDFEAAVLWRATLLYRLSCIRGLGEFHPVIRGDEEWNGLLSEGFDLRPPLHYYNELPLFYSACAVNFNATSLQMPGAVNQRVFDVPACGGFLITDRQEGLEELFEPGKEVVTYTDPEEIPSLVRFYLDKPGAREAVAGRARKRVLKEHTYRQRIGKMIQVMKALFG